VANTDADSRNSLRASAATHRSDIIGRARQAWIAAPVASGSLTWNTSRLYVDGILSVGQSGDFNANGVVDAADYVVWRKRNGSQTEYNVWRSHYGQPPGSGAEAIASAAVPEPVTLVLLMFAAAGIHLRRRNCAKKAPTTRRRVIYVNNPRLSETLRVEVDSSQISPKFLTGEVRRLIPIYMAPYSSTT